MSILCIAQLEDRKELYKQIQKQIIRPDNVVFYQDPNPAKTIDQRRKRIVENHRKLIEIVKKNDCDLVWQLEQDVVLPKDCLMNLIKDYRKLKGRKFGYVSAVQVGRHGLYHLGAWRNFEKDSFESLDHNLKGIQPVEATGFYCLLAPKHVWLKGKASWNGEPWGPDVNWGLSLRKKGYIIYVNMDIPIGHKVRRGEIWPSHASTVNVKFKKENDKWGYKTYG